MNQTLKISLQLGIAMFLSWGLSTISWRSVAQANYLVSIIVDGSLAAINFYVVRKISKLQDENNFWQFLGYTVGGVTGTLAGIWISLQILGK